jgi:hypothetical protein
VNLPYELIGQATVALVGAILLELLVVALLVALYAAWFRGWTYASNYLWRGYSPTGERPPAWKLKLSALCLVLRDVKPRKLRPAWEEADRLGGTVNGEDSDLNDARDYAEAVDP